MGRDVRLLLASQPTRGLDVGSIEFVHRRIIEERDKGVAVVLVSSELDEIYALSDRIAIMYEGTFTGFRPPDVPVEELGLLMAGIGGIGTPEPGAEDSPERAAPGASPSGRAGLCRTVRFSRTGGGSLPAGGAGFRRTGRARGLRAGRAGFAR